MSRFTSLFLKQEAPTSGSIVHSQETLDESTHSDYDTPRTVRKKSKHRHDDDSVGE